MAATAFNMFVKTVAETSALESIPSRFTLPTDARGSHSDSIPIVDFSLLTSSNADQRSKVLHDLEKACQEWGFFILVNHGIPETLFKAAIDSSLEFFDLPDEEKRRYEAKSVSDPIKSGSSIVVKTGNETIHLWRDFLKAYVHPKFNCPQNPHSLSETLRKYAEKTRPVFRKVLQAIGENLGLEEGFVDEALNLDECYQLYAANYYPACPQPDQAIGIPPHTDHGLLTFLIHNGVAGLQIQHNGLWFDTDSPQNSILVNTGDHLEILSNGKYKSVRHRAVVNTEKMRISVVMANGASPETVVAPAPQLVQRDGRPFYRPMKFIDYVEKMLSFRLEESSLDAIKINQDV